MAGIHWETGGRHVQVRISIFILAGHLGGSRLRRLPGTVADPAAINVNFQIPFPHTSDGTIISCSSASGGHLSISGTGTGPVTTIFVPLSSDLLYIWGRGALSHGTINFLPTTDRSIPRDSVRVDITPRDYSKEALRSTNICLLQPATNQRSIAILVRLPFIVCEGWD